MRVGVEQHGQNARMLGIFESKGSQSPERSFLMVVVNQECCLLPSTVKCGDREV